MSGGCFALCGIACECGGNLGYGITDGMVLMIGGYSRDYGKVSMIDNLNFIAVSVSRGQRKFAGIHCLLKTR
jgi:hypothetical protein